MDDETLRRHGSLVWRLILTMLGCDDQAAYERACETVECLADTEHIPIEDWRAASELLALRVADDLVERVGLAMATAGPAAKVGVMLDPERFAAEVDED
jgi:hypothetical protein